MQFVLTLCWKGGSFRFRKMNEVFDLAIRVISLLAYVEFIYTASWNVERFS